MPRRLSHPTSAELAVLVADLRDQVAALEAENSRLRAEVACLRTHNAAAPAEGEASGPPATPSRGKTRRATGFKANVVVVNRHRPRHRRAPIPGRRREAPDRIVVHAPTVCGGCGTPLAGGRLVGRRQVI